MRNFSIGMRGVALVALLAIVAVPNLYADNPPGAFDPLEARIRPPGGVASEARIKPPTGVTSKPSIFGLMLHWLRIQAHIG